MTTEEKIKELESQIENLKKESLQEDMEQWFKSILNGIVIRLTDEFPNCVYYTKDGYHLFQLEQDSENKEKIYLYLSYAYWDTFNKEYGLSYSKTQEFTKNMMEKYLKIHTIISNF